jgi:putative DNA primase/helicase
MNDEEAHEAASGAASSIGVAAPPFPLIMDGNIKRYHDHLNDKPGVNNAWYKAVCNPDGTVGGSVGSWKLQTSVNWCTSITRAFTPAEKAEFARQQAQARMKAETDRQQRKVDAAAKAAYLWRRLRPVDPAHPYIIRKGIQPHRARQSGAALVLDYQNGNGIITTLQFIQADGSKKFLAHGGVGGASHRFGGTLIDSIILAEGFATGATLHEATSYPVAVCGSAGNLRPVAVGIRERHPGVKIIIAGDADLVGRAKALEAAEAVGGVICLPDFEGEGYGD